MSATTPATPALSFERRVTTIGQTHAELAAQASRAVNASLTLRKWLIGFYLAEYEQQGTDRAQYGEKLIERLSDRLNRVGVSRTEARELRRYRQSYPTYPRIGESLTPQSGLFVSKDLLELPKNEEMQRFIEEQLAARSFDETNIRHITGGESGSSEGNL